MKAVVAAFNQEKALLGAISVIVKTDYEPDGSFVALVSRSSGHGCENGNLHNSCDQDCKLQVAAEMRSLLLLHCDAGNTNNQQLDSCQLANLDRTKFGLGAADALL